ncbi:MAG TPA: sigma-54 dependent transcriptional regulator [Thermoanaerobaculia bacterium]|nr:sigma-54 dependent transcriptional regulator [Thermoanaerobaculia bacterium]
MKPEFALPDHAAPWLLPALAEKKNGGGASAGRSPATPLVGQSAAHRRLLTQIHQVAPTDAEVLLSGPTGVGKELYARLLHRLSHRAAGAFVPVNCGALPNDLFENELFGHVGGAFTGARPQSEGLVAEADRGTLFLDEVDSLALPGQVKLLRLVQEKEYRRLGESRTRRADIRIVAATNADLLEEVRARRFREDLFFRLRVVPITVPPLRDRRDDIAPILAAHVARYAEVYRLPRISFTTDALARLRAYAWPGNVRELENCVRALTCLQHQRPVEASDLPLLDEGVQETRREEPDLTGLPLRAAKRELVNRFERDYLERALRENEGNIARAARQSGKARRAFFELMRKHGVKAAAFGPEGAA